MYTIDYTPYKLRDWISIHNLHWVNLSSNPRAISLLEKNYDNIDWRVLAGNCNAMDLIKKNIHNFYWGDWNKSFWKRFSRSN